MSTDSVTFSPLDPHQVEADNHPSPISQIPREQQRDVLQETHAPLVVNTPDRKKPTVKRATSSMCTGQTFRPLPSHITQQLSGKQGGTGSIRRRAMTIAEELPPVWWLVDPTKLGFPFLVMALAYLETVVGARQVWAKV